jgi:hypothetical protein
MALVQPTAENKLVSTNRDSLVMPCASGTVINQGVRLKLSTGLVTPTTTLGDDWVGVADFTNPVASLGDTLTSGRVLLKGNVVYFDAPVVETYTFGDLVYDYDDTVDFHAGAVCKTSTLAILVGTYVGLTAVSGGTGVRIPVKIKPSVVI